MTTASLARGHEHERSSVQPGNYAAQPHRNPNSRTAGARAYSNDRFFAELAEEKLLRRCAVPHRYDLKAEAHSFLYVIQHLVNFTSFSVPYQSCIYRGWRRSSVVRITELGHILNIKYYIFPWDYYSSSMVRTSVWPADYPALLPTCGWAWLIVGKLSAITPPGVSKLVDYRGGEWASTADYDYVRLYGCRPKSVTAWSAIYVNLTFTC